MIRTEIPFGYAFIALFFILFFVGACVFSVGLLVSGIVWKSRTLQLCSIFPAGCTAVVIALIIFVNIAGEPDWNPTVKSDSEIEGRWKQHELSLELNPDHTFTYCAGASVATGHWVRDDWNLKLVPDTSAAEVPSHDLRVIKCWGRYHIMIKELDDPDGWDGDCGLSRG